MRHSSLFCITLLLALLGTGCASKRAYTGHPATDLSAVEPGIERTVIESNLGPPEDVAVTHATRQAWYIYDRGYIGTLETSSFGEKLAWAPLMAWGELVSLGMVGWMTACASPCQKGRLAITYDEDDRVLHATESFLPDDHPLVAKCTQSAVRGELAVCAGVREQVRPSTLPEESVKSPLSSSARPPDAAPSAQQPVAPP